MKRGNLKRILRENLLVEGLTEEVFHFTTIDNAPGILKSDAIKAAPIFSEEELGGEESSDFSKGKYYYISTTTTKDPKSGYQNTLRTMGEDLVCFNLNGRAINQRYKSVRVDYFSQMRDSDKRVDEMEDRIIMDDPELGPLSKYVNEIHSQYHDDFSKKALFMEKKAKELGIPIYFYDEEKHFNAQNKDKAIDISSGSSEESDERDAISSIERNPILNTNTLLALSIYDDNKLEQRIKDKLSEMGNVERVLKKAGADSLDELFKHVVQDLESTFKMYDGREEVLINTIKGKMREEIKNVKSVSKDPFNRAIMHNFTLSMKKYNTNDLDQYLINKLGIEKEEKT